MTMSVLWVSDREGKGLGISEDVSLVVGWLIIRIRLIHVWILLGLDSFYHFDLI